MTDVTIPKNIIHFDIERLSSTCVVSKDFLSNAELNVYEQDHLAMGLFRSITVALSVRIPTYTMGRWDHPETWWDAVKNRWFPAWALRRWPVRWTRIEVKAVLGGIALPDYLSEYKLAFMAQRDGVPQSIDSRDRREEALDRLNLSPEDRAEVDDILDETNSDE